MYRKILLTTDGSELARSALPEVERLAGPQSEAVVVEVVDAVGQIVAQSTPAGFGLQDAGHLSVATAERIVGAQHEAARRHLDEAKAALEEAGIETVTTRVLEGLPGPAIVETAEETGCDVIVMATHGRSGIMRTMLGSVADYVVRHTKQAPVLLVRPADVGEPQPTGSAAEPPARLR